jgi:predicted Fe-Mo cluster-binding NifX family protein
MRIAIPSDDGTNVAGHTGRASGFVIYDIENNEAMRVEYRTNSYTAHAKGECEGDNHHTSHEHRSHEDLLGALHDCNFMLAHGMGPRLVNDLARKNIRVTFCDETLAEDAAKKLAAGQLATREDSGCCHH